MGRGKCSIYGFEHRTSAHASIMVLAMIQPDLACVSVSVSTPSLLVFATFMASLSIFRAAASLRGECLCRRRVDAVNGDYKTLGSIAERVCSGNCFYDSLAQNF